MWRAISRQTKQERRFLVSASPIPAGTTWPGNKTSCHNFGSAHLNSLKKLFYLRLNCNLFQNLKPLNPYLKLYLFLRIVCGFQETLLKPFWFSLSKVHSRYILNAKCQETLISSNTRQCNISMLFVVAVPGPQCSGTS